MRLRPDLRRIFDRFSRELPLPVTWTSTERQKLYR
jgi:hypothetical protein